METRTPKEISRWLKRRSWYHKYVYNLINEHLNREEIVKYVSGEMKDMTISGAFKYSDTEEGITYWGKKEEQFLRWYYHQGKEIFRCKWFTIQI